MLDLYTLHLHLDAQYCLEVSVLRGVAGELRELSERLSAERGVRFGDLRLISERN